MNMSILLVGLALLLAVYWFVRKRAASSDVTTKVNLRAIAGSSEYHAVSLKFTDGACAPAREMKDRRFLASAAPKLPLPECDVLECNCRFVHFSDRRASKDRRSPFAPGGAGGVTGVYDSEQRGGKERRNGGDSD